MRGLRPVAAVVMVIVAGIFLAVGALPGSAAAKPKARTVTIKNFKFSPSPLKVKAGSTITIKNADSTTHTFTANNGAFDTGDIERGSSASVTIKTPGTFAYHCQIHNFMKGTIKTT
jgi:plastocyanin